jgi:predicted ArsR family transcriptional regulator
MAKQTNGAAAPTQLQQMTHAARMKIMRYALKHGSITSAKASEISGYRQVYFHLIRLAKAGLLEHAGYNQWKPAGRARRPASGP